MAHKSSLDFSRRKMKERNVRSRDKEGDHPWKMGRSPVPLLTFLDICSLLDLGGWLLSGDLGQERGEAEEQVGPPKLHAVAPAGAAAAACFGLGPERSGVHRPARAS